MTLPLSGIIKLSQVNVELSRTSSTAVSLNQTPVRTLAIKPSGKISMSDLYGKAAYTPTLRTMTFNSTTTWTRPAITTSITMLSARGGTGSPAQQGGVIPAYSEVTTTTVFFAPPSAGSGPSAGRYPISNVALNRDAAFNQINGGSSSFPTLNVVQYFNDTYSESRGSGSTVGRPVNGSASGTQVGDIYDAGGANHGVGGEINFSYEAGVRYAYGSGTFYPGSPASQGGDTYAFGYSFTGGNGGVASTSTYYNIPIGSTSYLIQVPYGGSVTIQYYA